MQQRMSSHMQSTTRQQLNTNFIDSSASRSYYAYGTSAAKNEGHHTQRPALEQTPCSGFIESSFGGVTPLKSSPHDDFDDAVHHQKNSLKRNTDNSFLHELKG